MQMSVKGRRSFSKKTVDGQRNEDLIRMMLVMGVGNRLMMDDGIGIYIVEELIRRNHIHNVRYVVGETDVDFCMVQLMDADYVIILDAGYSEAFPCTVFSASLETIWNDLLPAGLGHDFDLLQAMKRNGMKKKGLLITVEISQLGFWPELSDQMKAEFDRICNEIEHVIETFASEESGLQ